MYISNLKNKGAKNLLRKFWGLSDTLHYEIDQLSFEQFAIKYKYLNEMLDRVSAMEGCTVTVNLFNLIAKAKGKYGEMFENKFPEVNLVVT